VAQEATARSPVAPVAQEAILSRRAIEGSRMDESRIHHGEARRCRSPEEIGRRLAHAPPRDFRSFLGGQG
jgi:hypothetical protein